MPTVYVFQGTHATAAAGPLPGSERARLLAGNIDGGFNDAGTLVLQTEIAEINDPIHLDTISLPAIDRTGFLKEYLNEADYLRIDDGTRKWFYAITDYNFTSSDVVSFSLVLDPFMTDVWYTFSDYTVNGLAYLDEKGKLRLPKGVVTRTNTPDVIVTPYVTDDMYQLSGPPTIHIDPIWHNTRNETLSYRLVALTIDPTVIRDGKFAAIVEETSEQDGKTTTKIMPGENYNTPKPSQITFSVPTVNPASGQKFDKTYQTQGYSLFWMDAQASASSRPPILDVMNQLQALDMGDCIVGAYELPGGMVSMDGFGNPGTLAVRDLTALSDVYTTSFKPRALFPNYDWADLIYCCPDFTYTLRSVASGDSLTDRAVNCTGTVVSFCDPRPDGRPYFILPVANVIASSEENATYSAMQSRMVSGAQWMRAAISLTRPAGSYLGQIVTSINQRRIEEDFQTTERQMTTGFIPRLISNLGNIGGEMGSAAAVGGLGSLAAVPTAFINAGVSTIAGTIQNYIPGMFGMSEQSAAWFSPLAKAKQEAARAMIDEKLSYLGQYGYVGPVIKSQPAETLQNFTGNGALFIASVPSAFDVARFGVTFAMFGRKTVIPIAGTNYLTPADTAPTVFVEMAPAEVHGGLLHQMQLDRLKIGYRFWLKHERDSKNIDDVSLYWKKED